MNKVSGGRPAVAQTLERYLAAGRRFVGFSHDISAEMSVTWDSNGTGISYHITSAVAHTTVL